MTTNSAALKAFVTSVCESQKLWLLGEDDDYLVVDSVEYENSDVMPIFSSQQAAEALCVDEWAAYQVISVDLEAFFEEWLPGLDEAGVLAGIDLNAELEGEEFEFFTLAKAIADLDSKA